MLTSQFWICTPNERNRGEAVVFVRDFTAPASCQATLSLTAKGVYCATLNGKRIGDCVLAPGYTMFCEHHLYQTYDVSALLRQGENRLEITVAAGWYAGRMNRQQSTWTPAVIAELVAQTETGEVLLCASDAHWQVGQGPLRFSDIYDGEIYDATASLTDLMPVTVDTDATKTALVSQGDAPVMREQERFISQRIFTTPKGETVIDFGQNFCGYPQLKLTARAGETVAFSFAEVLDPEGNFYTENYRGAKCTYRYICRDGAQTHVPCGTFYGFRYVRIDEFPASATLTDDTVVGIAIYSDLKQTGRLSCSNPKLNQLFSNTLWGQRSNFLDIPMDCPQRDERLGWTGDAQAFCRAACYQFDSHAFYRKWFRDMEIVSRLYDGIGFTVPTCGVTPLAAAYSDAALIMPWQVYRAYGDRKLLEDMLDTMIYQVELTIRESEHPNTWRGGKRLRQFGDWLAPDGGEKDQSGDFVSTTYSGATDPDFIQAAFYAYDLQILICAQEALGRDSSRYRDLLSAARAQFQKDFPVYHTQTECVLALHFGLTDTPQAVVGQLSEMIVQNGNRLATGFVGTAYLLQALSEYGRTDLAYTLLLQERFPSWLFPVTRGSTTMWEHWDGINEQGQLWHPRMNSFNHYAYGSVSAWVFEVAAGIGQASDSAGFAHPVIAPHPDRRLEWLEGSLQTAQGEIRSKWVYTQDGGLRYEITVPCAATVRLGDRTLSVERGSYVFYEKA